MNLSQKRNRPRVNDEFDILDPYSDKATELNFLNSKPSCFIVMGKPGAGCSTLSRMFANELQCEYINPKDLINRHLEGLTEKGKELQAILEDGGMITEDIVMQLIKHKMDSPEVAHRGYVLDGFPNTGSAQSSTIDQFEALKLFSLSPDYIIYLKIPDGDLENRLKGIKMDPQDGKLYFKQNYDPDFPPPIEVPPEMIPVKEKKADEEEEEEPEEEDEEAMEEGEELAKGNPDFPLLDPEAIKRLLKRPEDFPEKVQKKISNYKDINASIINDYIDNFNSTKIINLNGNLSPEKNFQQLMERTRYYPEIRPAVVPIELYYVASGGEDEEEPDLGGEEVEPPDENADLDELFREICSRNVPSPGYRWQRSEWSNYCPVALLSGILTPGKPRFAVAFLNKVYLLSTEERMKDFVRNPRPYLVPNQPKIPCKICVVGAPGIGKTSISHLLANFYKAKVIDMQELMKPYFAEAKEKFLAETLEQAKLDCVAKVKSQIKQKLEAEKTEIMADKAMDKLEENAVDSVENDMKEKVILDHSEDDEKNDEEILSQDTIEGNSIQEEVVKDLPEKLPDADVSENDPEVLKLIEKTMEEAAKTVLTLPVDIYINELEKAITAADEHVREETNNVKLHGSWVLDNFPTTKDQWNMLLESDPEKHMVPDQIVLLKDESDNFEYSLQTWYKINKAEIDKAITDRLGNGDLETAKPDQEQAMPTTENLPPPGPELSAALKTIQDWNKEWTNIEGSIRNSTVLLEIIDFDINNQSVDTLTLNIIEKLKNKFEHPSWEMTDMDLEEFEAAAAEADEDVEEEEEEEAEEEEEGADDEPNRSKKKPLGDSNYWCPVALKNQNVLYPGNPEIAVKYMGKMYYMANEDNKNDFIANPKNYIPTVTPPKSPPLRMFFLGAKGSGKTIHARHLAEKMNLFHISFHEILQEFILPKNRKKIGPEFNETDPIPDFILPDPALEDNDDLQTNKTDMTGENVQEEINEEKAEETPEDKEQEVVPEEPEEVWDENENAVKDYLENRTPLTPELLTQILMDFWQKDPFTKQGFILEGFPKTAEEAQFVQDSGIFVDCAVVLQTSDDDVIERLLTPRLNKWKERRFRKDLYKQKMSEYKAKKKQLKIDKRRREILQELEAKRNAKIKQLDSVEKDATDEDMEEEEDEEDLDEEVNIEDMLAEEFGEEEEEEQEDEEEETEEEAEERIRNEIMEIYAQDTEDLEGVLEKLQELQIPRLEIEAGAKMPIVRYRLNKKLKKILDHRESLFERCYSLTVPVAEKLLRNGYYQPSKLGRWCPVKCAIDPTSISSMNNSDYIMSNKLYPYIPIIDDEHPTFPVVYRNHIYFLSSKKAKDEFMINPMHYLKRLPPKLSMPIRLCILGLPKSGKTTLAQRFIREYGLMRITGGEAVRHVLNNCWNTELAKEIKSYLIKGLIVPHELVVQAIDVMMLDVKCNTRGYVLDGYPLSYDQIQLLNHLSIIPTRVIELIGSAQDLMLRANKNRSTNKTQLPFPMHDSPKITAVKMANYNSNISAIRQWYGFEHDNIRSLDSSKGKWLIWEESNYSVKQQVIKFQEYFYSRKTGQAARIHDLCITPSEFQSRLSPLHQYCPVRLYRNNELFNNANEPNLRYAAEYGGFYYKMSGLEEFNFFCEHAAEILSTAVLPQYLPEQIDPNRINDLFPMQLHLQGYCPVCFVAGKCRYEGLVLGNKDRFIVEYRDKLFALCSDNCLENFMKFPSQYWDLELPKKLPPIKNPLNIKTLPLPGYLEQSMADALRNALTATGTLKPKHPFIDPSRSALLYIALHLKAYNPKSPEHLRKKYKRKLEQFEHHCDLIKYLSDHMTLKYKEVEQRPAAFDEKLNSFLNLKKLQDNEDRWINM